jgi:hypothetical protein
MPDLSIPIAEQDDRLIAETVERRVKEPPALKPPALDDSGAEIKPDFPVKNFPMKFLWQRDAYLKLFDRQVDLLTEDVGRALQSGRMVVYISCPISSRGGGFAGTNVEIALHVQNKLQREWGEGFWFLNPAQYQMESKAGTGLILHHARQLQREGVFTFGSDQLLRDFVATLKPTGGDYMRMWTRVLVEDELDVAPPQGKVKPWYVGGRFAAFYFVGASDAAEYFRVGGGRSLTAGVEDYFARKFATDATFNAYYSPLLGGGGSDTVQWRRLREQFVRYYTVRYGTNASLGSHDEWNIWYHLNQRRLALSDFGTGSQIAGYYDGRQIDLASSETATSRGYATE